MISPSMIKAWIECKRKMAWDYVDLIPRSHTTATEYGEKSHDQAELYLSTGQCDQTTDHGQLIATGFHLLPPPMMQGMALEKSFEFDLQDVPFHGIKDVEIHLPQYVAVFDHKTTSDWRWAKSEAELRHDPQCLIYAMDSMLKTGHKSCHCVWNYFKKRGRKEARQVHFIISYDECLRSLQPYIRTAHQIMTECVNIKTALDLSYNTASCMKYGGCQYRQHCNLDASETIGNLFRLRT